MSQDDFLNQVTKRLNAAAIPFMIGGSLASSLHGEPRATNGIDLIIDPDAETSNRFVNSLPADWYISAEAAIAALGQRSMFNVIDTEHGWKADLIIRKNRRFSVREFSRKIPATILGTDVSVVTPEDSILSKLEWSVESDSPRQYRDALGVAVLNRSALDIAYLKQWARDLGLEAALVKLLAEADRRYSP